MSEPQQQQPVDTSPKMSKFLWQYRKKLSLLKTKSFYANHLCKRNCLQGKLNTIPDPCFNDCDNWLKGFYQLKRQKTPQQAQTALYQVQAKYDAVKKNDDLQYQKAYARAKLEINGFLEFLDNQLNKKIQVESAGNKK